MEDFLMPDDKAIEQMNQEYAKKLDKNKVFCATTSNIDNELKELYKTTYICKQLTNSLYLAMKITSKSQLLHQMLMEKRTELQLLSKKISEQLMSEISLELQSLRLPYASIFSLLNYNIKALKMISLVFKGDTDSYLAFITSELIIAELLRLI